jgi:DNA polymerase-3 subunit delta'
MRFKAFSYKKLEIFIRNYLDSKVFDIHKEIDLEYFINSANGSPGKILKDIEIWNQLPNEIKENLDFPLSDNLEILKITKLISEELDIDQQMFLINFVQHKCWVKTRNKNIIKKLENLKVHLKGFIQPRLAWEVTLLKIAIEDL